MKKEFKDLKREFDEKVIYLREQLINIENKDLKSILRRQYAFNIAVTLRAMICHEQNTSSLCRRCNYDSFLFFQLYDIWSTLNTAPDYKLVSIIVKDKKAFFEHKKDIVKTEEVCPKWLKFNNWLNEVVIDFKSKDIPPLSRFNIVKLIADKLGAHVDSEVDKTLEEVKNTLVMPIKIILNGEEIDTCSENLYIETIISIGQELLYAYDFTRHFYPVLCDKNKMLLYIQKYDSITPTNVNNIPCKYFICSKDKEKEINCYNSIPYFPCNIIKQALDEYEIRFRDKTFKVLII